MDSIQSAFNTLSNSTPPTKKTEESKLKKEESQPLLPLSFDQVKQQKEQLSKMLYLGDHLRKKTILDYQAHLSQGENSPKTTGENDQFEEHLTLKKQLKVLDEREPSETQSSSAEEAEEEQNILNELHEDKVKLFLQRFDMEARVAYGGMDQDDGDNFQDGQEIFYEPETEDEEVDESQADNYDYVQLDRFNDEAGMYQGFDF